MKPLRSILFFSLALIGCRHSFAPSAIPASKAPVLIAESAPTETTAPCDLPDISLKANPVVILPGNSTTLTWSSLRAGIITLQPDIGSVDASGEKVVSPAGSTTYTARATGPCGTSVDILRVTVTEVAPNPPTIVFGNDVRAISDVVMVPPPPVPPMLPIEFDFDSAEIRGQQDAKLQATAAFLRMNGTKTLIIEGHADERGSEEYNLALGERRANVVKHYLQLFGVAAERITTVSFGEERPICAAKTEVCFAQNRLTLMRIAP